MGPRSYGRYCETRSRANDGASPCIHYLNRNATTGLEILSLYRATGENQKKKCVQRCQGPKTSLRRHRLTGIGPTCADGRSADKSCVTRKCFISNDIRPKWIFQHHATVCAQRKKKSSWPTDAIDRQAGLLPSQRRPPRAPNRVYRLHSNSPLDGVSHRGIGGAGKRTHQGLRKNCNSRS